MIRVVQPAYQALPNGGQGSFSPLGSLRLSWVLVLATSETFQRVTTKVTIVVKRTLGRICNGL